MLILNADKDSINRAASMLLDGKLIAFPTETVYGLGAPIFYEDSIRKIFEVKQRPSNNPLIAHVCNIEMINDIAILDDVIDDFKKLANAFMPGPLTILLPKKSCVPCAVTAGLDLVGVRIPNNQIALELIHSVGQPIVAPSANISGRPSPVSAMHVIEDLGSSIGGVIDGGECCFIGIESTVLELSDTPVVYRPGGVSLEDISMVLDRNVIYAPKSDLIKSPGTMYKHYSPNAIVKLCFSEKEIAYYKDTVVNGNYKIIRNISRESLYKDLRDADKENLKFLLVLCSEQNIKDVSLMDRLNRAAGIK